VQAHEMWFTGIYFVLATIFLAAHGLVWHTIAFGLLVPLLWLLAIATYTGKRSFGKIAGLISLVDAVLFLVIAFSAAIGKPLA